jgi:SHS2 domain-containing protein
VNLRQENAGFREIAHTADWELEVWAPNFPSLLVQSALGMYSLSGIQLKKDPKLELEFDLDAMDAESLLVDFLSELNFIRESQNLAFDEFDLDIKDFQLHARLGGKYIEYSSKEIKAVTFHQLRIIQIEGVLNVNIVFDV